MRTKIGLIIVVLSGAFVAVVHWSSLSTAQENSSEKKKEEPVQPRRPEPLISPQIGSDGTIVFRLSAPNAKVVSLAGEIPGSPVALVKDEKGIWSAAIGPLTPELYSYSFIVDGLRVCDPANAAVKPMRSPTSSVLEIAGSPPLLHDFQNVPHGTVHVHNYQSQATESRRRMHVYTPPGYEKSSEARFPTLYLFHGSGDNDACWTEFGRANWILDNLIAQGKARPMILVMTDGHARPANTAGATASEGSNRNQVFEKDLLGDVMPFVESSYRVQADRLNRAIIGLSMGGGQSLGVGLNHLELFAWVGGMSTALRDPQAALPQFFADPSRSNAELRLLWVACGRDDGLVVRAREFSDLLKEKGIRHEYVESAGGHAWGVWRKYLAQFAPLLFVEK